MKDGVKMDHSSEVALSGQAKAILDEIKAEPVPAEIMDLALRLQARIDAKTLALPAERRSDGTDKI